MIRRTTPPMKRKKSPTRPIPDLIPSGSTMLNLACSDSTDGAFSMGTIVTLPGGTDSGKTMLALSCLCCCAVDNRFDDYELIHDDVERKMRINIPNLFPPLEYRLNSPPLDKSNTIEDFELNIMKLVDDGEQFIYILDTPDALTSDDETEKAHQKLLKMAKSPEDVRNISGTYAMEKAKTLHRTLREVNSAIEKTKSLLIMIQQVKQKIGATQWMKKETTSGGNAPGHYSIHRIWTKTRKPIKNDGEIIGSEIVASVEKNHLTGKLREAIFNIYYDYGIDDVSSMIDWLIDRGCWRKAGSYIIPSGFMPERNYKKSDVVEFVEESTLTINQLKQIVQSEWNRKEEALKLNRKRVW